MNIITIILIASIAFTGIFWFYDLIFLRPDRKRRLHDMEISSKIPLTKKEKAAILDNDSLVGNIAGCFLILVIVFLVRAFAYEPFRIPSASMMPTLLRGDFILVNKYRYGLRNPFTNKVLVFKQSPKRGDIVVFRYPEDHSIDYVKRIVGLPGDTVVVNDNRLYIRHVGSKENQLIEEAKAGEQLYLSLNKEYPSEHGIIYNENLIGFRHRIMHDSDAYSLIPYAANGGIVSGNKYGEWIVPEGHYFAMGDNREHSRDSRYWGFVSDEELIGPAVCVWFSVTMDDGFRILRLGGID